MTIRLFVADDSVTIQKIVSLAFSGEDVLIEAVSDGNSALDRIYGFRPDIVLADVFMPGCGGYEVCERIKNDPLLSDIPVVLLVGTFEPFDEAEASRVGCDGFLTKPFDTSELIRTVHELVKNRTMAPEDESESPVPAPDSSCVEERKSLVSPAAMESFLGRDRILDIVNPGAVSPVVMSAQSAGRSDSLTDEKIDLIVERVVRKMSDEVIREVAWEIVPELSESIIRRVIQEQEE